MNVRHQCHFCGEFVRDGFSLETGERHWLSDCRPDLVEHEPGPLCTWYGASRNWQTETGLPECYGYQERGSNVWTTEHKHFYTDGPT